MSVTAWLQHISSNGLQRIKRNPEVFEDVLMDLSSADDDEPLITDFSELTPKQLCVLKEITSDIGLSHERLSIWDIDSLELLKSIYPDIYERLKPELYTIVIDEKECEYLDLGDTWSFVDSLFRFGTPMEPSTIRSNLNGYHRINIFSGKPINPSDRWPIRYQEVYEVQEMSQLLASIDESEIQCRFEEALRTQSPVYRYGWHQESYPQLLEFCKIVQLFYRKAASKGFGIVNAIG
ncbi:DUF1877 family protein [Acaryochloris marina NIES-2412]|uniref:DUF1877 family protein n=1 Tax=Acaryochloris marina TaxID=155978 RepID=UPI00405A4AE0